MLQRAKGDQVGTERVERSHHVARHTWQVDDRCAIRQAIPVDRGGDDAANPVGGTLPHGGVERAEADDRPRLPQLGNDRLPLP